MSTTDPDADLRAALAELADAWDDPDPERGDPDRADAIRDLLAEHQPTAREAERCAAMFPCHPTPEFPCDNPGGDHRCALDKGHHGEHVTPGGWR